MIQNYHKKESFALVYVMLFVTMVLMIIVMISGTMVTSIKLQRNSQSSIQAYNLARYAIDVAWAEYLENLETKEAVSPNGLPFEYLSTYTPTTFLSNLYTSATLLMYKNYLNNKIPSTTTPTEDASSRYNRVNLNDNSSSVVAYNAPISSFPNDQGVYDYKLYYNRDDSNQQFIKTVGYFKGTKVVLIAIIKHQISGDPDTDPPRDKFFATFSRQENGGLDGLGQQICTTITGSCGSDIATDPGLQPCALSYPLPPPLCDRTTHLTNINFNHSEDKITITQVGI